jgi:hypothetical protein
VGVGTLIQAISYGSILLGALAAQSDEDLAAGPAFALGFGLVPMVFVVVALISRRRNAPVSILKAMGAWLVFALPLGLFNPVTGLVAGFSAGGALTLRAPACRNPGNDLRDRPGPGDTPSRDLRRGSHTTSHHPSRRLLRGEERQGLGH